MAFALVQTATQVSGSSVSSLNITLSATGAGNLVCVFVRLNNTCTVSSVSDDVGNTYALSASVQKDATNTVLYLAYGVQTTGGATTVTVNTSASATLRAGASEFSGGASSNAAIYDTSASNVGWSTSSSVASMTLAATGELVVAAIGLNSSTSITAGSGFTMASNTGGLGFEYKLSSAASETCPATFGSIPWSEWAFAFKPASGGAAVNSGFFRFM